MPFIPHTDTDIAEMLADIQAGNIEALFDEITSELRSGELTNVPEGINEMVMLRKMSALAEQDTGALSFIGAGAYEHHIPSAIWDIITRGEFMTAYTPYQAEASQGTLQLVYEFQSMIANLTAMEVSNASLYDGGSALAEAALMAVRANKQNKSHSILMPQSVHPYYRKTVETIVRNQKINLVELAYDQQKGCIDIATLNDNNAQSFAAVVIAQPNFFGSLEDVDAITDWAHSRNALVIAVVNPISLALLKPPGEWGEQGADIVIGEGQPLGIPLASGGPYFGFMSCRQKLVRQMPGRIIGRTVDLDGKVGFTLTLQAREQHIRRSKATSNICTNQGLAMMAATIYMSLLGYRGLHQVASSCYQNTQQLAKKLTQIYGVELVFQQPHFHEVVVRTPMPSETLLKQLENQNILGGYALDKTYSELNNCILVCATETKNKHDIDQYAQTLASILQHF